MLIRDMFRKKIDRELQGVIVVGQNETADIAQELDEYVVTNELQRHFADFFAAYKKSIKGKTSGMGVWISGFFGSGKSHFLKILSYLLANKTINGKTALQYFKDDNKIADATVLADMQLAANTSADVILFNIDSKSEATSKQNKEAIVSVFLKVFNELQGYYGSIPHLADLERNLDENGKFDEFKTAFAQIHGDTWENSRQAFYFIQDNVVKALVKINFLTEEAARNWCETTTSPYQISIEDFAKRVKAYIDKKDSDHHVVFLIDEVGQYIGDNTSLMLNLQTVVEDLGKECNGKCWVIVTSQQDIDSVTQVKGNDFSKIQGRFKTRLSLSSANVDAVIKKRILDKIETAAQTLQLLYDAKSTIIKNLIVFNDGIEKKLYASADDFAAVYPFVPYQFNLLASSLTSIRRHGASGKHLSEGERSMLALFKESAMQLMDKETGALVPFHKFYDALANFLDSSHSVVITRAYDNTYINPDKQKDVFAINVLKTLFMIKYVKEIKPNLENITSLMVENIDDDRLELKTKVENALKLLTSQTLVQKLGDTYTFLSDEEQEISREIKNQNIETSEVIGKAYELIFDDILSIRKYTYPAFKNRYSFSVNQAVDSIYKAAQASDIGVQVLTPWCDENTDEYVLKNKSQAENKVIVLLPDDDTFLAELRDGLKIERFLRFNAAADQDRFKDVIAAKQNEKNERNNNARLYLTESLKNAVIFVNGDVIKNQVKAPSDKINDALGQLVKKVYFKLNYIDTPMDDNDLRKTMQGTNNQKLALNGETEPNAQALNDMFGFIDDNTGRHIKTTMKTLKDRFMKAPYGFIEDDIFWLVARLFKRGDINLFINDALVNTQECSNQQIIDFITKKINLEKLSLKVRPHVAPKDIKNVRDVMKELKYALPSDNDEDTLMKDFKAGSDGTINYINGLLLQYQNYAYPGQKILETGKNLLQHVAMYKEPVEFFAEVSARYDDFMDFAEDYERVKNFFTGTQCPIFTTALEMLAIYDDSKAYIADSELENVVTEIRKITCKAEPYADIMYLPELIDSFRNLYDELLTQESKPVQNSIEDDKARVLEVLAAKPYKDKYYNSYVARFAELSDGATHCNNISNLRGFADKANALKMRLLDAMVNLDAELERQKQQELEKQNKEKNAGNKATPPQGHIAAEPPAKYNVPKTKNVSIKRMAHTSSWRLQTAEDVDKYLEQLRHALLKELETSDIVNIEF